MATRKEDLKPFWRKHLWLTKLVAVGVLLVLPLYILWVLKDEMWEGLTDTAGFLIDVLKL